MSVETLENGIRKVQQAKTSGKKIVLTNGCFDILHAGHVEYLEKARSCGDMLVVAVNLDSSVSRLKPGRPYNTLADRMALLAALRCVDVVIPFKESEDTADHLLRAFLPNVYAKGGDYTPETLPEAPTAREVGAELALIQEKGGYSTTQLIQRIKSID